MAPLWELPPVPLLKSMIAGKMDSILIKVASFGLKKVDLGKNLA